VPFPAKAPLPKLFPTPTRLAQSMAPHHPLLRLTPSVADELGKLHGSHDKAVAFRERKLLPGQPADGSGVLKERVLVINDLHVAAGRDSETGRWDPLDEFLPEQQRQLTAMLANEWIDAVNPPEGSALHRRLVERLSNSLRGASTMQEFKHLVCDDTCKQYTLRLHLNGDLFDFLWTPAARPGFSFPDGLASFGRAPRNTPANALVQLNMIAEGHPELIRTLAMHLLLGHHMTFTPGNHDRHPMHPLVWDGEITFEGRTYKGLRGLLAEAMKNLGAAPTERAAAMSRFDLQPFAIYGDTWVAHGDMEDRYNRVRRPYGELLEPSPIHKDMELAFGDHGVRDGFNDLKRIRPKLGTMGSTITSIGQAFHAPRHAMRLLWCFLQAADEEGYTKSPKADEQQRIDDVAAIVKKFPQITERLNALRPDNEKLSEAQVIEGLQAVERAQAQPLFSNFKVGTGFFRRAFTLAWHMLTGTTDMRRRETVYLDTMQEMYRQFGVANHIRGHRHIGTHEVYINKDEHVLTRIDAHTWMDKNGIWGSGRHRWGEKSRGVGVIEIGVDANGKPWSETSLMRIVDRGGNLVPGDFVEDYEWRKDANRAKARAIYAENHAPAGSVVASPVTSTARETTNVESEAALARVGVDQVGAGNA
jgi:hypothetical protein